MKKFDELIATRDKFSVKVKMFYLTRKGRNYDLGPDCIVTFIKDENIEGVLKTKNGDLTIYHKGIIEPEETDMCFQGEIMHARKCKLRFSLKNNPETEKIPHLKFLLQDIVFEDWVNEGFGFMITIDDILKIE